MYYLCATKNGNNEKMFVKLIKDDKLEVKIIDRNDKLLSKEIVNQNKFNTIYRELIEIQLNHRHRLEFWESL